MPPQVIDLTAKLGLFSDPWQPRIVAQLNDYHLKLAKIEGEFVWHSHPETDEMFLVIEGEMNIEFRDGTLSLSSGQMCVVPRGVEHRPTSDRECHILLIEPAGTSNTGDAPGDRTAPEKWI